MKTRLNKNNRNILTEFMHKKVTCPEEEKEYEDIKSEVKKSIEKVQKMQFPLMDMTILKKYDCSRMTENMRICIFDSKTGNYASHFPNFVEIDLVLHPYHNQYNTPSEHFIRIEENGAIHKILLKKYALLKVYKDAIFAKQSDYKALIKESKTFEAVVAVWSEAEQLREDICQTTALSVINKEAISRIKNDVDSRKKGAK